MLTSRVVLQPLAFPRVVAKQSCRRFGTWQNETVSKVVVSAAGSVGPVQGLDVMPSLKYGALLVDAGGTLLQTAEPVEETYAAFGLKHGVNVNIEDIKKGFKRAFTKPWPGRLRYEGDGRPFWRYAVTAATGCSDEAYFEELYQHFARAGAWRLASGAYESLSCLKDAGVKLAVVSNFDSRLRPLLEELNVANLFTAIIVSSEIGYEKPNPKIFEAALNKLDVQANEAIFLGDDPIADKEGAKAVGLDAWLWKKEVHSFEEVADRILQQNKSH